MAVTKEQFERYKQVKDSGVYNMWCREVQILARISAETQMEILSNYDKLAEQFGGNKNEND